MLIQRKARNIYAVNSTMFVLALLLVYTAVAAVVSSFLPDSFYTFSQYHKTGIEYVWFSLPIYFVFFYAALSWNKWLLRQDELNTLMFQLSRCCFFIALIQWGALLFLGFVARFVWGLNRGELLGFQHSFLVSGTSFIFIFAFVYACRALSFKGFVMLCFVFMFIDFIYMGKKFVFYMIALTLYRFDSRTWLKTSKPVFFALLGGAVFATLIYVVRALAGGSVHLNLYSFFAEFVGVISTVGFAVEHEAYISSPWAVVSALQPYYYDSVGHGLALHPTAYFVAIGGDYWLYWLALYMLIFLCTFIFLSMLVGDLALILLLVNVIHFFRHGPDIFMYQFLSQALVVCIVSYTGLVKLNRLSHTNLLRG